MDENQRMSIRGFLEMVLPHSRIVLQDIPYDNYKGCLRCTLLEFYGLYWQGAYLGRQYVRLDDQLVVCRAAGILGDGYVPGHLQDLKKDMRKMRACGLI